MELFDPIVEEFTAARTNEARMQIASKFYAPNTYDRGMEQNFQDVKDVTNFKSKQKSEQHRTRGNTAYQSGQKKVALNLYTESIANAPSDSVELSLAYANRSAVLRAMGKCRECLVDIERALSRGYPTDKSFKLLLREMLCHRDLGHGDEIVASFNKAFNLLQSLAGLTEKERADLKQQLDKEKQAPRMKVCPEVVMYPEQVPELSYGPNSEVLGASSAVRIEYSLQHGRHLVATRDIEIGDVLLIAEHLVVTLRDKYRFDNCAHCHKLCHNLLPCPNCALVMFCSDKCQTEAGQKYHLAECAALSRMRHVVVKSLQYPMGGWDLYDRVIRVLAMIGCDKLELYLKYARTISGHLSKEAERTKGFNSHGVFDPSNINMIFNLRTDVEQHDPANLVMNGLFYIQIPRCLGIPMSHPDFFAVVGLCLQLLDTSFQASSTKTYIMSEPIGLTDVAVCFNPLNSLVQHSCVSNTTSVTYGNKCVSIAKCPIPEGIVITESFLNVDLRYSKEERHEMLQKQYTFPCYCDACLRDEFYEARLQCISDPLDLKILNSMLRYNENEIMEMCKNFSSSELDNFKKERYGVLTKLWKKRVFHDFRFSIIQNQLALYEAMKGNRVELVKQDIDQNLIDQLVESVMMNRIN